MRFDEKYIGRGKSVKLIIIGDKNKCRDYLDDKDSINILCNIITKNNSPHIGQQFENYIFDFL